MELKTHIRLYFSTNTHIKEEKISQYIWLFKKHILPLHSQTTRVPWPSG